MAGCKNMKIITEIARLKEALLPYRTRQQDIGLVPTMGALHEGHLSLVETAIKNGDIVVVSIFVNPTQFNDPADLESYPRDLESDLDLLKAFPVKFILAPGVEEIYPEKDTRKFDLSPLDSVLEGKYRPGHFNGVAQVVSKLFNAVMPDIAYFGEKDFQQLAVIRKLVRQLNMDIQIVGCPIIREPDGLAMSSRNRLLTPEQRKAASMINQALQEAVEMKGDHAPTVVTRYVNNLINSNPHMEVDYFEIVDADSLLPIKSWDESGNIIGCIAVQLKGVRLIDNRYFR